MMTYWDKLQGSLMSRAMKKGDKKMIKIISDVIKVLPTVKDACIRHILKKSAECGAIAFFQWRNLYPNAIHTDLKLVTEVLEERIENLYSSFRNMGADKEKATVYLKPYKNLHAHDLKDYSDIFVRSKPFNVQSFKQIGLIDPFYEEDDNNIF